MAGAFVGWQLVLVAFFVSVFPALVLGLGRLILYRDQHLAFGPSLALGVLITLLGWRWAGPHFAPLFFDQTIMLFLAGAGAFFLLLASFFLRLLGGTPEPEPEAEDKAAG
jgi:leader peptidase (prepilin peptidase) / N-methyltransferase